MPFMQFDLHLAPISWEPREQEAWHSRASAGWEWVRFLLPFHAIFLNSHIIHVCLSIQKCSRGRYHRCLSQFHLRWELPAAPANCGYPEISQWPWSSDLHCPKVWLAIDWCASTPYAAKPFREDIWGADGDSCWVKESIFRDGTPRRPTNWGSPNYPWLSVRRMWLLFHEPDSRQKALWKEPC